MALTVTIQKPFQAPAIDSIINNSGGGSWDAGTYDFMIVTRFDILNSERYGEWSSPRVKQLSVSVNDNDSVTVNYTVPAEAGTDPAYINIYYKDNAGTYEWKECAVNVSLSSYGSSYTITSPYKSLTSSNNWTELENLNYHSDEFYGLDLNSGIARIKITGSSGDLYLRDIIDALDSSADMTEGTDYHKAGRISGYGCALITTASIDSYDTTGGRIILTSSSIMSYGGIFFTGSMETETALETSTFCKLECPRRGGYNRTVYITNADMNTSVFNKGIILDAALSSGDHNIEGTLLKNSYVLSVNDSVSTIADNTFYCGASRMWGEDANSEYDGITLAYCSYTYFRADKADAKNCKFYVGNTNYQIFWLPITSGNFVKILDCEYYNYHTGLRYTYDQLDYNDWNYYGEDNETYIEFQNTIALKITDKEGNNISGASVVVTDKDGATVIDTTTDDEGEISQAIAIFRHYNIDAEGPIIGGGININYNPFTITITKSGYRIYQNEVQINDKVDWKIALLLLSNVPPENDVESGVIYDDGDNNYTGNLQLPAASVVKKNEQYGSNGTEFTGTYLPEPAESITVAIAEETISAAVAEETIEIEIEE